MEGRGLRLIDAVATGPNRPWKDNTQNQCAIDANAILERKIKCQSSRTR